MKKNLLSVLILVLLVVNIAMSAVMMISVTSTNGKTADLITTIATVLQIELYNPGGVSVADVPLENTEIHDVTAGEMYPLMRATIVNEDGSITTDSKQPYIIFNLSIAMNTEHEDYKKFGANISNWDSSIKDVVNTIVTSHTEAECHDDFDGIRQEILAGIQQLFGSDFIFKIEISGIKYG